MGDSSFLSTNIMSALNQRNIITLAHARNSSDDQQLSSYWTCSNDLGFEGELAFEWDHLRREVIDYGSLIHDTKYKLMWIGGDNFGKK